MQTANLPSIKNLLSLLLPLGALKVNLALPCRAFIDSVKTCLPNAILLSDVIRIKSLLHPHQRHWH